MPLRPAGGVSILLGEGRLKAMSLHIGLIHQVDAVLVAQLIPVPTSTCFCTVLLYC